MESKAPSPEAVSAQLERICGSPGFDRSPRLRRFLRYLVHESRAGRADGLKEYAIGVEVFDRGAAFDPRLDPIVRVEARRLRAKLADYYASHGANDPIRIEVPTGAYEAIVREAPASVPESRDASAEPIAISTPPTPGWARGRPAWTTALALALGGGLWWHTRLQPPGAQPSPFAARGPFSVAVLPLSPIGEDPSLAAFSDGLTEDIITQLARLRGLRVIARTSVSRFKQTQVPIRLIAKELGVETVLEGSVRRERGLLRITAQLIEGHSEGHLWAQSYDRTYADTLAIQGEVAREVTRALALHLSPEEERRLLESGTTSAAAHEGGGRHGVGESRRGVPVARAGGRCARALGDLPGSGPALRTAPWGPPLCRAAAAPRPRDSGVLARRSIVKLEVSRGKPSRGKHAFVGAAIGVGVGGGGGVG